MNDDDRAAILGFDPHIASVDAHGKIFPDPKADKIWAANVLDLMTAGVPYSDAVRHAQPEQDGLILLLAEVRARNDVLRGVSPKTKLSSGWQRALT